MSQFSKATPRKTNQRGKKRSRSMSLTDTHVINALEAEAAKVKRTTVHRLYGGENVRSEERPEIC